MENFVHIVTCPVCLKILDDPRKLDCGHIFCLQPCLQQLVNVVTRHIKCPLCRASHNLFAAEAEASAQIIYATRGGTEDEAKLALASLLQQDRTASEVVQVLCANDSLNRLCEKCCTTLPKVVQCTCGCSQRLCTSCRVCHLSTKKSMLCCANLEAEQVASQLQAQASLLRDRASSITSQRDVLAMRISADMDLLVKLIKAREVQLLSELATFEQSEVKALENRAVVAELTVTHVLECCATANVYMMQKCPLATEQKDVEQLAASSSLMKEFSRLTELCVSEKQRALSLLIDVECALLNKQVQFSCDTQLICKLVEGLGTFFVRSSPLSDSHFCISSMSATKEVMTAVTEQTVLQNSSVVTDRSSSSCSGGATSPVRRRTSFSDRRRLLRYRTTSDTFSNLDESDVGSQQLRSLSVSMGLNRSLSESFDGTRGYELCGMPTCVLGAGSLVAPRGLALSRSDSLLYVSDYGARRIARFDVDRAVELAPLFADAHLQGPSGLALCPLGQLVLADSTLGAAMLLDCNGTLIREFGRGQLVAPCGVACDPLGFLYIADPGSRCVHIFNSEGSWLRRLTLAGEDDAVPLFVALSADGLRIAVSYGMYGVRFFDPRGRLEKSIGGADYSVGCGRIRGARGLTLDTRGFLLCADSSACAIQCFRPCGAFHCSFGSYGSGAGQFKALEGLTVTPDGQVFVCDSDVHRVQVF